MYPFEQMCNLNQYIAVSPQTPKKWQWGGVAHDYN